MPRTIAIGDMHGCAKALDRLLLEIQPTKEDTIVGIGDYVDRGMESAKVIDMLIELVNRTRLVPLIGNHELMMYQALFGSKRDFDFWFQHGGNATLASYGGIVENIPQPHIAFLSQCIRYFETETHFFVHACYDPELPLDQQPDDVLFWQHIRAYQPPPHENGKIAVVGHTPQAEGFVVDFGHINAIDTYCYGDQWLSALDVSSGQIWQANNLGELRKSRLESDGSGAFDDLAPGVV